MVSVNLIPNGIVIVRWRKVLPGSKNNDASSGLDAAFRNFCILAHPLWWRRLIATIISALTVLTTPMAATADTIGPACVVDGNTLNINGKRLHKGCTGGTAVRLIDIIAPDLDQLCEAQNGRKWYCGRASATILLEAVKGRILKCQGKSKDSKKRLLAVCFLEGKNLNKLMVRNGWALAYGHHSEMYFELEKKAAAERKGLWQTRENAIFEWRNR